MLQRVWESGNLGGQLPLLVQARPRRKRSPLKKMFSKWIFLPKGLNKGTLLKDRRASRRKFFSFAELQNA